QRTPDGHGFVSSPPGGEDLLLRVFHIRLAMLQRNPETQLFRDGENRSLCQRAFQAGLHSQERCVRFPAPKTARPEALQDRWLLASPGQGKKFPAPPRFYRPPARIPRVRPAKEPARPR